MIKTELSSRPASAELSSLAPLAAPSSSAALLAGSSLRGSSAPNVGHGEGGNPDGSGGGAGGGSGVGGESGLGDVNWSDDEALDAMVDDISREVDGEKRRRNCFLFFLSGKPSA